MDPYEETRESWNKVAQLYNDNFMDHTFYDHTYNSLCDLIPAHGQVLEIGCGPGNITRYIKNKRPDLMIDAIDSSPQMIELAQQNNPGVSFRMIDGREIGTLNKQYEAIVCGFCLPYLNEDDCSRLFNDCKKLLVQGGIFYLSFVEGDSALSGYVTGSSGHRMYFHFHPEHFIMNLLNVNGFLRIQKIEVPYSKKDGTTEIHTVVIAQC